VNVREAIFRFPETGVGGMDEQGDLKVRRKPGFDGNFDRARSSRLAGIIFQFCTVSHFATTLLNARYSSLMAASSVGKDPRVLITRLRLICNDSTAFVVYTIFRTSSGKAKNGVTRAQLSRHSLAIRGILWPLRLEFRQ
jgi:hypothetical protein